METINLVIGDHMCTCWIEGALRKLPGVDDAAFNPVSGILTVWVRPGEMDEARLRAILRGRGMSLAA